MVSPAVTKTATAPPEVARPLSLLANGADEGAVAIEEAQFERLPVRNNHAAIA